VRTIYLDHNIVRYFIRGFPSGFPADADKRALDFVVNSGDELRFVVSDWNFIEACSESSSKVSKEALVTSYADFLLELKPLYLPTTFEIKKAEMLALVTRHLRLSGDAKIPVFNETHSQARSVMGVKDVLLKYTLKDFMLFLLHRPSELQKYQKPKQDVLAAQMTIRSAIAAGRYNSHPM
jgi:hypothetical protein